ncbi:DMT family transporter [Nitratidesulfovibrio sp. D1]|uniref:DMT family transporter n=1 Tax=Nitratidesulfovibrio sp. D1 TaxID=3440151 RepID=UPI003EBF5545
MEQLLWIMLALLAGATLPTQAGINAALQADWARHPALASLISFTVGTAALALYVLASRIPFPSVSTSSAWQWTGGLLGAFFVTVVTFLAPRLGATAMIALVLAGQMAASVTLDHFGLLGYPERPLGLARFAGLTLVAVGVFLVRRF